MSKELQKTIVILLLAIITLAIIYPESITELKNQNITYLIFFIIFGGGIIYLQDRIYHSRKFRVVFFRKFNRKARNFIINNFLKIEITLLSVILFITIILVPKENINISLLQTIIIPILF